MLQNVWSQGPGNTWAWSVSSDAWRPALVIPRRVQYKLAVTVHRSLTPSSKVPRWLLYASLRSSWSPASAICHQLSVPRVRRSIFGSRAISVAGPTVCNIHWICAIQLLTSNNLGGTWRRICYSDIRSIKAVVCVIALYKSTFTYLLTSHRTAVTADWSFTLWE